MPRYKCYGGPMDGAEVTLGEGVTRWYANGDPSPPMTIGATGGGAAPELPEPKRLTVYKVGPHPNPPGDALFYQGEE